MSVAALDKLPVETLEKIFTGIEYDRDALIALGLACHALLERTRPYFFPHITLHDHNLVAFLELTHGVRWNSILPYVQHLSLGSHMFPLSSLSLRRFGGQAHDLTSWASQFHSLQSLHLRGGIWSEFPQGFKDALLSLRVEHLDVCIGQMSLEVEEFTTTVFPVMRFKALSITGPSWQKDITPVPFYPTWFDTEPVPFYIHYIQLYQIKPLQGLVNWLRGCNPPPPVIHLFIALPKQKDTPFAALVTEVLQLITPVHLHVKLPVETQDTYEFPVQNFKNIRTLRISSIYNDSHLGPDSTAKGQGDIPTTCSILQQFIPLQHQVEKIQLDSVCSHLNLVWGNIPELLNAFFPRLKVLILTVRSGKMTSRKHLEEWLDKSPFGPLRDRGVKVRVELVTASDLGLFV